MAAHPVVHFEIGCRDGAKTRQFLNRLFGWRITPPAEGMTIDTGAPGAIGGHIAELAPEWGSYVTVYVEVESLEATLAKAGELGGRTLVPRVDLPDMGSFAWLATPEGNILGIWEPLSRSEPE